MGASTQLWGGELAANGYVTGENQRRQIWRSLTPPPSPNYPSCIEVSRVFPFNEEFVELELAVVGVILARTDIP